MLKRSMHLHFPDVVVFWCCSQKQADKAGDNLEGAAKDAKRNVDSAADDAKGGAKDAQRNVESGIDDARSEAKRNL